MLAKEGYMLGGRAHSTVRVSAALMASLEAKLRLSKSSRTRSDSQGLQLDHLAAARLWADDAAAAEFFTADPGRRPQ